MTPLPLSFYESEDVVFLARSLLGKLIVTSINHQLTGGIIAETEAYAGREDRASHAYQMRSTPRNQAMFGPGGTAYVYLCYGIHFLLNVVTAKPGIPHAVLLRAMIPILGIDTMLKRRNKCRLDSTLSKGPGTMSQALGITKEHNSLFFQKPPLMICESGHLPSDTDISIGPRIGVGYAEEDALLPYRFTLNPRSSFAAIANNCLNEE